ncbi:MAG: HAD-IIIA family hydrolase [Bacteroidetes bacterium]|nr:HAD-IIIA family hydrolase [Bacteroidota bacterium]
MQENFKQKLNNIKCFAFDIDGVLTNGQLLVTEEGNLLRTMNIKDGYALKLAMQKGYEVVIISGAKQKGAIERLRRLGIENIFSESKNKQQTLNHFLVEKKLTHDAVLFMGDDMPDLEVMKNCGIAACPSDAVHDIKSISIYVSPHKGGEGAARDVIEQVLRLHAKWE